MQETTRKPRSQLTILVVDDERLLTMMTVETLTDLGHKALQAGSGAEALKVLASNQDIALMITDHAMPGMTGAELAKQALRLRPDLKVILATGYARLPDGLDIALERLPKPYFERDLVAVIDKLFADGLP